MALQLVTTTRVDSWATEYQMGHIWEGATAQERERAVETAETYWQTYEWKTSPFTDANLATVLEGILAQHARAILETRGQPRELRPRRIERLLRPYLGFAMGGASYTSSSTTTTPSTGGSFSGVDQVARDDIETLQSELDQAESNIQANTHSLVNKANNATVANKLNRNLDNLGTVSPTNASAFRAAIGAGSGGGSGLDRDAVDARIEALRPNDFTDDLKNDVLSAKAATSEVYEYERPAWVNVTNARTIAGISLTPYDPLSTPPDTATIVGYTYTTNVTNRTYDNQRLVLRVNEDIGFDKIRIFLDYPDEVEDTFINRAFMRFQFNQGGYNYYEFQAIQGDGAFISIAVLNASLIVQHTLSEDHYGWGGKVRLKGTDGQVAGIRNNELVPVNIPLPPSTGLSQDEVDARIGEEVSAWALDGNTADIPREKVYPSIFDSDTESAVGAANQTITFDIDRRATTFGTGEAVGAQTFAINLTADQARDQSAFLRGSYVLTGAANSGGSWPRDLELEIQNTSASNAVVDTINIKDDGEGEFDFHLPIPMNNQVLRWVFKVTTGSQYTGTLVIKNCTFHDGISPAGHYIRQIVSPEISDEAEARQRQDEALHTEIARVDDKLPAPPTAGRSTRNLVLRIQPRSTPAWADAPTGGGGALPSLTKWTFNGGTSVTLGRTTYNNIIASTTGAINSSLQWNANGMVDTGISYDSSMGKYMVIGMKRIMASLSTVASGSHPNITVYIYISPLSLTGDDYDNPLEILYLPSGTATPKNNSNINVTLGRAAGNTFQISWNISGQVQYHSSSRKWVERSSQTTIPIIRNIWYGYS